MMEVVVAVEMTALY